MSSPSTRAAAFFGPDGMLVRRGGLEHRPQQSQMAAAVADALDARHHLLVEAPTGVGKTLAYLLPALLHAGGDRGRVIVSTWTKTLQDQIMHHDLPLARRFASDPVAVVPLKGRRNYLCTTRLRAAAEAARSLFPPDERDALQRILAWAQTTPDGDVEGLGFLPDRAVWSAVCSEKGICSSALCDASCFFQQARERARSAGILVVNHALFFSLLRLAEVEEGFLFEGDAAVLDEAHQLEQVASSSFGRSVSRRQMQSVLRRLYHRTTRKGLLTRHPKHLRDMVHGLQAVVDDFFDGVAEGVPARGPARMTRVRGPLRAADPLTLPLAEFLGGLGAVERGEDQPALRAELAGVRTALEEDGALIGQLLEGAPAGTACWVEVGAGRDHNVTLQAAPADVAGILRERVFTGGRCAVLVSATLGVGGSMDYVRSRVGADGVQELTLDTPFDFRRQMCVCLAQDIPEPENPSYADLLPEYIRMSVARSRGRALVLFTSQAVMLRCADALAADFEERGWHVLVQSADLPRSALLEEFRRDVSSVLFGLDSYWMGVDVPGEALEHVIITKLPFAVPTHPLVETRLEMITARGGNPFVAYTLPEAVLKVRQGLGRLIRTATDTGTVTFLDSRLLTRSYGRVFLESLPRTRVELLTRDGEVRDLPDADWS